VNKDGGRAEPRGPIFVGGAARSGKTLVSLMLSSLPQVVVARRTEMWPRFYGRFGDLGRPANLERCLRAMLRRSQISSLCPDSDQIRREFHLGEATYARLFALVQEQNARRAGKSRWGDQTALIERFADELMSAYGEPRVIHMVRDPRDRHEAILRRAPRRAGAIGTTTSVWLRSVALGMRHVKRYPESYKIVRYESLVTHPEETMRDLCAFLGEEFDPAILRMEDVPRYRRERGAARGGSPISADHVGRYRETINRCDLAFIQAVAAHQMLAFDYVPDPVRISPGEGLRYAAIGWPLGLARMGYLRAVDAFQRYSGSPIPSAQAR
jgi:hypothetical protein